MEMRPGLFQQQTLKLAMTQELSQAIALLQYSSQELQEFIDSRILENPLISVEQQAAGYEPVYTTREGAKEKGNWLEQVGADTSSLENHLLSQLDVQNLSRKRKRIFLQLIRNLDENGYMQMETKEMAVQAGCTEEEAVQCLTELQMLEPYGIGARSLQECLVIQTAADGGSKLASRILRDYFLLFAEKKWKEIAKALHISLAEIQKASDYIQQLNPRPGAAFVQGKPHYITPDVIVENRNGRLVVRDVEGNSPTLKLDAANVHLIRNSADKEVNRYWQEKWAEYQWLNRGIQYRKETILRVMAGIVEKQQDFFLYGSSYLKPLTMKEIADDLDIHESTVSRAVRDKYVQTPFGMMEMRAFFTSSLSSANEEEISGTAAKKALLEAVNQEDKRKPLSDQELTKYLRKEFGILLSRRTTAKYRSQLGILSSTKRKRYE